MFVAGTVSAQKIKVKDDIAYVDGASYVQWKTTAMNNEVSVMAIDSTTEEIFLKYKNYIDPNRVSNANPDGKVRWVEVNFLSLGIKCEVDSRGNKGMIKLFYLNNLYQDGKLDEEAAKRFVQKYGTSYTDNRPGNNVKVIINN